MTGTATALYTAIHTALLGASKQIKADPIHARIALAVHEAGDDGLTTGELEQILAVDGGHIRGALGVMYERGLADGNAVDGGPRRRGIRTRVKLTASGHHLAREVIYRRRLRATLPERATDSDLCDRGSI